jgi:hypothetical protein
MNIKEKQLALKAIIDEATKMLGHLKQECPHPIGTYKYDGDSGNWSSSDDSYWKTLICSDCGKIWTEDHEINGVRNPAYHNSPEGQWVKEK